MISSMKWWLLTYAAVVTWAADIPQQIHIAFAGADNSGNPNGMTVSWQTVANTATSQVRYGVSSSNLDMVASGSSSTYYVTYDHHVVLKDLEASTKYYYQCGDDAGGWSDVLSFVTAPSQSTTSYPINIMIFGDMGMWYSEDSRSTLQDMANHGDFDWTWHLGDVGYADDDFLHEPFKDGYEDAWNAYMNDIQGWVSTLPYMVNVGNHEAECHSPACWVSRDKLEHLSNFTAYNHRFRMPSAESGGNSNMWYSFNYGPIHFVNIDTETNYEGAPNDHYTWYGDNGNFWGDQMAWLEADLKKAASERNIRPWIFVGGHRPLYSLKDCDDNGFLDETAALLQAEVEGMFLKYQVDAYWAGHRHAYERQLPVYNTTFVDTESNYKDPKYTFYILSGAPGNDEEHSGYDNVPTNIKWNVMFDAQHYGLGQLTVLSENEMSWKYFDSATHEVLDSFTFSKNYPIDVIIDKSFLKHDIFFVLFNSHNTSM